MSTWYKAKVTNPADPLGKGFQKDQIVFVRRDGSKFIVYTGSYFTVRDLTVEQCKGCLEVLRDAEHYPIPVTPAQQIVLDNRYRITQKI